MKALKSLQLSWFHTGLIIEHSFAPSYSLISLKNLCSICSESCEQFKSHGAKRDARKAAG